jgi:WD40 repeat protein
MKYTSLAVLLGVILLLSLVAPATSAVTPLWREPATVGGELSGVIISADGSTIIAGGDQLISLTPEGRKRWTGLSGTCLDISNDGDYILASQGQNVRLISATGTVLWDQSMGISITDLSLAPDASTIVATGGGKVMTITFSGEGIASNASMSVNHLKIMPPGDRVLITTSKNVQLSNFSLLSEWSDANSTQNLIAVAIDGSSFLTASGNRVRKYTGKGNLIWDKKVPGGNAEALAASRDGSMIVIGMDDSSLHVLNSQGLLLWNAYATNWITSVAVSDNGDTIAAGSLDKKLYVFDHDGTKLGNFTTTSAIKFNSVAVTGDGSLIVVVDESAVYGLSRESFTRQVIASETTEVTPTPLPVQTARTTRITTRQTPYPTTAETPEASLPPAVPLVAMGLLFLCRFRKT